MKTGLRAMLLTICLLLVSLWAFSPTTSGQGDCSGCVKKCRDEAWDLYLGCKAMFGEQAAEECLIWSTEYENSCFCSRCERSCHYGICN